MNNKLTFWEIKYVVLMFNGLTLSYQRTSDVNTNTVLIDRTSEHILLKNMTPDVMEIIVLEFTSQ